MSPGFRRRVRVRTVPIAGRHGEVDFAPEMHHALVLVYPSWDKELITDDYLQALDAACGRALAAGRPVFCDDDFEPDLRVRQIVERAGARPLPYFGGGVWYVKARVNRRRAQAEVNAIAAVVGMAPSEMHVAFGGMYADGAVSACARLWCRIVRTSYPEEPRPWDSRLLPRHPFAEGTILTRLTLNH